MYAKFVLTLSLRSSPHQVLLFMLNQQMGTRSRFTSLGVSDRYDNRFLVGQAENGPK